MGENANLGARVDILEAIKYKLQVTKQKSFSCV